MPKVVIIIVLAPRAAIVSGMAHFAITRVVVQIVAYVVANIAWASFATPNALWHRGQGKGERAS